MATHDRGITGGRRSELLAGTLLLLAACYRGTPAPGFTAPYDAAPPAQVIAYIENELEFETLPAYGDEQRLMLGTCPASCSYGPRVRIEPEKRSYRNRLSALGSSPGRIIARMISYDATPYPKFNLGPQDTVYWAVSEATATRNPDSLASVSLFISIKGLRGARRPVATRDTSWIEKHSSGYTRKQRYDGNHARAYWIWTDADEKAWGFCAKGACCR